MSHCYYTRCLDAGHGGGGGGQVKGGLIQEQFGSIRFHSRGLVFVDSQITYVHRKRKREYVKRVKKRQVEHHLGNEPVMVTFKGFV